MPATRITWKFDALVTQAAADWGCDTAAFALANGSVRLVELAKQEQNVSIGVGMHKGAILALAAHPHGGFVTGGEDGAVRRLLPDGTVQELARHANRWIDCLAIAADGTVFYAVGKQIHRLSPAGEAGAPLGPLSSTISGLDLKAGLLAVSHYNGATVFALTDPDAEPQKLEWKGSHLLVTLSPDGAYLATSMQDGEVHAWRLADRREMRMSGYVGKIRSLAFSADTSWLATAGADVLVVWPFDGKGPEGREPLELLDGRGALVTRVAAHPVSGMIACGFESGNLGMVDLRSRQGGLWPLSKRGPVTALAWSRDGHHLLSGSDEGRAAIFSADPAEGAAA
jgi:WD40 repeat protein